LNQNRDREREDGNEYEYSQTPMSPEHYTYQNIDKKPTLHKISLIPFDNTLNFTETKKGNKDPFVLNISKIEIFKTMNKKNDVTKNNDIIESKIQSALTSESQ